MELHSYTDAGEFLDHAGDFLRRDIVRHQVILGVASMAADQPDVYPEFHGFLVTDDRHVSAAATQTPPHNFIVADPTSDRALEHLIGGIRASGLVVPGVLGNEPHAGAFARQWSSLQTVRARPSTKQGVFSLEAVADLDPAPGEMRLAHPRDRDLLVDWWAAFQEEALPDGAAHASSPEEQVELRLDPARSQGLDLWEFEDAVVAMSGHSAPVHDAVRIGPVYTPRHLRGRGYATALVSAQSRRILDAGSARCLLHTDLTNPTSNAIYQRIGYHKVAEAAEYLFD